MATSKKVMQNEMHILGKMSLYVIRQSGATIEVSLPAFSSFLVGILFHKFIETK